MKIALSLAAVLTLALSATGCTSPGEAYANDVCACPDAECIKKAGETHAEKFPASKAKLSELDKLSEDDKKHIGKAMECMKKHMK